MPVEPDTEPLLLLVLPEPVTVPELEPVVSRPRSRGAFASVDVECRDDSVALRPLARFRDFVEPWTWLQSHMQSLPSLSLPITWLDDVSLLDVEVPIDVVSRLEVPVVEESRVEALPETPVLPVALVEALPVDGFAVVALLLSLLDEVSLLVALVPVLGVAPVLVLLLGFERSAPVCAIAAGAARARARIAVGASFIDILR